MARRSSSIGHRQISSGSCVPTAQARCSSPFLWGQPARDELERDRRGPARPVDAVSWRPGHDVAAAVSTSQDLRGLATADEEVRTSRDVRETGARLLDDVPSRSAAVTSASTIRPTMRRLVRRSDDAAAFVHHRRSLVVCHAGLGARSRHRSNRRFCATVRAVFIERESGHAVRQSVCRAAFSRPLVRCSVRNALSGGDPVAPLFSGDSQCRDSKSAPSRSS